MRRGLISWSKEEVPAEALERRVGRLQAAMRAAGLDAVFAYTTTAQPAAVSWLTHFVPYSNDGLLVVLPEGAPVFFASFSKRVQGWIHEVSHIGEVRLGPQLGRNAVKLVQERMGTKARTPRIGLIGRDGFPWTVAEALLDAGWRDGIEDAAGLFASIRQPADAAEIGLAAHAAALARRSLDAIPADLDKASRVLSAVESAARRGAAEEVILRIAPDLASNAILQRIEDDADLGSRYAVQLSLSYKGVWVRETRCLAAGAMPRITSSAAFWDGAKRWFAGTVAALEPDRLAPDASAAPGTLANWSVEACIASVPLSLVACGGARSVAGSSTPSQALPAGSLGVISVRLDLPDGPWLGSAAFVLGEGSGTTQAVA